MNPNDMNNNGSIERKLQFSHIQHIGATNWQKSAKNLRFLNPLLDF